MESVTELFSGVSETLRANFLPIVIVLCVVLLITGWIFYNSKVASVKETYTDSSDANAPESEEAEASDGDKDEEEAEQSPTE